MAGKTRRTAGEIEPPQLGTKASTTSVAELALRDGELYADLALTQAELWDQTADDVVFERVLFRRVGMTRTRLTLAQMVDVRFDTCELTEVDWSKIHVQRAELNGCRMIGAKLMEASLRDMVLISCNAELAMFWATTFERARFERCSLREASFQEANLTGVVFDRCDLSHADLRGATLVGADFRGSTLDGLKVGIKELQGAIIDTSQAVHLAGLLGIVVK